MEKELFDQDGNLVAKVGVPEMTFHSGQAVRYWGKFYRLDGDVYREINTESVGEPSVYTVVG